MTQDLKLSDNFWLSELIKSSTAERLGIDNYPTETAYIESLSLVAQKILEPVLEEYKSVIISSCYRSPTLNEVIHGAKKSQHMLGQAVDLYIPGISNYEVAIWIKENIPIFDQLILEFHKPRIIGSGWCHISIIADRNRKESLTTADGKDYLEGLLE